MFVSIQRENDPSEHRRLFLAGVAFVAGIASLIALSIGIYTKVFEQVTTVTLMADRAGLQLPKYGDVRYNGVLVGQIRDVSQTGDQAVIVLGLEPEDAEQIPSNVEASILPTTLFGQKYVALAPPAAAAPGEPGIEDGTVIPSEHVHTSVELNKVLDRLFPLLRAVRPADLSATLGALATALNGRGEALGQSLDKLDAYLSTINGHLPTLRQDLRLLATVADAYNVVAPDFVAALGHLTVTSRTITSERASVEGLLGDLKNVSKTGAELLEDNEINLVRSLDLSRPLMQLLDKYSPEYNCLLRGIAAYKPILLKTFEGGRVKQYIEFPSPQVRSYDERDLAEYADRRGPRCLGLPDHPPSPAGFYDTANGTDLDSAAGRGNSYLPGGQAILGGLFGGVLGRPTPSTGQDVNSSQSGRQATTALLSARTGTPADQITDLSSLMYAPMAEAAR